MKNLWVALLAMCVSPALAQEAAIPPAEQPSGIQKESESLQSVPVPGDIPVVLQQNSGNFPPLPPSRPCARPDTDGLWQLKNVFEKPRGPTSADFANNPYQYILFMRDSSYRTFKEVWGERTPNQVKIDLESAQVDVLQQFVVHDSGIVFFYVDGKNVDTQACFIVANERGPYKQGNMILMPPEGRIATRLALVYERVEVNTAQPQPRPAQEEVVPPARRPRAKK